MVTNSFLPFNQTAKRSFLKRALNALACIFMIFFSIYDIAFTLITHAEIIRIPTSFRDLKLYRSHLLLMTRTWRVILLELFIQPYEPSHKFASRQPFSKQNLKPLGNTHFPLDSLVTEAI